MNEGAVKGVHLSSRQLPDHHLLLFSQTLGSRGLSFNPFSLLPPDQGPSLLHSRIRHDHCKDSQEQTQAAAEDGDRLVTRILPFSRLSGLWAPLEKHSGGRTGVLPVTVGFKTTPWNSGNCCGFWVLTQRASVTALPLCSGDLDGLLHLSFLRGKLE